MAQMDFLSHLKDPAPGFLCYRCTDATERLDLTVRVRHELNPPASPEDLMILESLLERKRGHH